MEKRKTQILERFVEHIFSNIFCRPKPKTSKGVGL